MSFQSFAPLPHELPPAPPQPPAGQQSNPFSLLLKTTGAILTFNPRKSIELLKWESTPQPNGLVQIALLQCGLLLAVSLIFQPRADGYGAAEDTIFYLINILTAEISLVVTWPVLALLGMLVGLIARQKVSFMHALSASVTQTYLATLLSLPPAVLSVASNLDTPFSMGLFLALTACTIVLPTVFGGLMLCAHSNGRQTSMMFYVALQLAAWTLFGAFYIFTMSGYLF